MPRPRKFDENKVLSEAMDVFWQKGYASTSTEDLEQATQIKRGSLYNAYKDKRTLFFRTLEHYGQQEIENVVTVMTTAKTIQQGYAAVLAHAIRYANQENDHRGCLLCDAASELGAKDKQVADRVNDLFKPMADVFLAHFSLQAENHTEEQINARVDNVMASYMGFRLMCKLGYSKERLHALSQESIALLGL
ncbi:TetR/AcrR family transcriptional regulator [Alteromonadaceae bacterium M269]|nr:TetR/AcrR family transcriptional regulator [Alteromonadaceae bacterium M269]